jgi:hypothetical protein
MLGDHARALAIALDTARRLDRDYPGSPAALHAHVVASIMASQLGDPIARPEAELALPHPRETANPTALAAALFVYGMALTADDPAAALAAFDESIALSRQGASPSTLGAALNGAVEVRVRTGDLPQATRALREGIERSHQNSTRFTFYNCILSGIEILIRLAHLEQAAIFDGIATTGHTTEYRAGPTWVRLRAAIASARAAHGPEQYDAAFQTGAQMTYDQAVDHALRVLDDVINETNDTRAN